MEWQPIETAPKDGTSILVWLPDLYRKKPFATTAWWGSQFGTEFWQTLDREWDDIYAAEITHWVPMPTPPCLCYGPPMSSYESRPDGSGTLDEIEALLLNLLRIALGNVDEPAIPEEYVDVAHAITHSLLGSAPPELVADSAQRLRCVCLEYDIDVHPIGVLKA